MKALTSFLDAVHQKYGIVPDFVHTDNDPAEIGAVPPVWPNAKHQLCWWHMHDALKKRLAQAKLSTVPYHPFEANAEFGFIRLDFLPRGRPDMSEDGADRRKQPTAPQNHMPGPIHGPNQVAPIRLPASQVPPSSSSLDPDASVASVAAPRLRAALDDGVAAPRLRAALGDGARGAPVTAAVTLLPGRLRLLGPRAVVDVPDAPPDEEPTAHQEPAPDERHVFCPEHLRQPVIDLMDRHFMAHPLIPGSSAPTKEAIRWWAVEGMYQLCESNDLPNLWAYLWERWYQPKRWVLWARSPCDLIPRLRTTMICESQ
jgi:hypothetical protein